MKTFHYLAMLLLLAGLSAGEAEAQRFTSKKRYWAINATFNAMNYFGDIVPKEQITSFDIDFTKPTLGVYLERRLLPNTSFRAGFAYGVLKGDDYTSIVDAYGSIEAAMADDNARFRLYRNLHFRNQIVEFSGSFTFDLKGNRGFFYQRPKGFNPYATIGVGIVVHGPQAREIYPDGSFDWVKLRPLQTEGQSYGPIAVVIPMGIGVKYRVNDRIDIAFEAGYRWALTDYLDDVSGRYYNHTDTTGGAVSRPREFAFRGNDPINAFNEEDRTAIIDALIAHYTKAGMIPEDTPRQEAMEKVEAIYTAPLERRGNDGSPLLSPEKKRLGIFSGANDVYMVYGFHIKYIMGGGVKCPKFR